MQREATNESSSSSSEQAQQQQQTTTTTTTTTTTVPMETTQVVQARGVPTHVTSTGGSAYSQTGYVQQATYTQQPTYTTTTISATQGAPVQYTTGQTYATLPVQTYSSMHQMSGATSSHHSTGQVHTAGSTMTRGQSVATETSRVVGVEYGEQRVVSVSQRVDETRQSVLSERYEERRVRVPKKIVREEVIEKVIVVPEKIVHEEIVDEIQMVREKIIEVARPTIIEKIVEVPEIEIVEKIIEVPEKVIQEKIREEIQVQYQERIVEVPKIQYQERIVEVPEVQYREVPVEKIVEVPEYRDEVRYTEVPVPQYIDKPVPNYVTVEVPVNIERKEPVPVEAEVTYEYRIPQLKAAYSRITYPVYLPRFIEVPVAAELLNANLTTAANQYIASIQALSKNATSLCEIEELATKIMHTDFHSQLESADLQTAVLRAWESNALKIGQETGIATTTASVLTK